MTINANEPPPLPGPDLGDVEFLPLPETALAAALPPTLLPEPDLEAVIHPQTLPETDLPDGHNLNEVALPPRNEPDLAITDRDTLDAGEALLLFAPFASSVDKVAVV